MGVNQIILRDHTPAWLLGRTKLYEVSSVEDTSGITAMKTNALRQHRGSIRNSATGPLFLLMLLVVSSFTSIVTELDAWRQICNLAETIFVVIATPATIDAVVESTTEGHETQDIPVKCTLVTVFDDTKTARISFDALNSVRYEPPPRHIHTCRADRPRGPPASG